MRVASITPVVPTEEVGEQKPFRYEGKDYNRLDIIHNGSVVTSVVVNALGQIEVRTTGQISPIENAKPARTLGERKKRGCCF